MNTNDNKFKCTECGEKKPLYLLSRESEKDPAMPPVCVGCQDEWADILDDGDDEYIGVGRTDRERFIFCGITLDPAKLQAWQLSY